MFIGGHAGADSSPVGHAGADYSPVGNQTEGCGTTNVGTIRNKGSFVSQTEVRSIRQTTNGLQAVSSYLLEHKTCSY